MKSFRHNRSIFTAQLLSYLTLISVVVAAFGFLFFYSAKQHLEAEIGKKLQDISNIASHTTPYQRLKLIEPGAENTRMVRRLLAKLGEIKQITGIRSISVFTTDNHTLLSLPGRFEIGSPAAFFHLAKPYFNQLRAPGAVHTSSYEGTSDKLLMSAFSPILDKENNVFAVLAVQTSASELNVINSLRMNFISVSSLIYLFAVFMALLLARALAQPIRSMAKTVSLVGQGKYDSRVPEFGSKELVILAKCFNQMTEQVAERNQILKEMAASVAHEIRNPLNSIKLLVTLIAEQLSDQRNTSQESAIQTLYYEIGKLDRFLSEYLTYSRPVVWKSDIFAPEKAVQNAIMMASGEAREFSITLRADIAEDIPLIQTDRARLEQALLNIVLNAIQASVESQTVTIGIRQTENGLVCTVADHGSGIEDDQLHQIYQPFFTTKKTGSGLGLANTRQIIEEMKGEIRIKTTPASGTTVTVILPPELLIKQRL